jgi:hydroxypyruvate reductase
MSRDVARACVEAGVAAADPERAVRERLTVEAERLRLGESTFDLADYDRVVVAGGGKAAAAVARGLVAVLGDRIDEGYVVTDGDTAGLRPVEGPDDGSGTDDRRDDGAAGGDEGDPDPDPDPDADDDKSDAPPPVEALVGDHPVPSERNVEATERVVDLLSACDERTLVLAPVTGGGSALLAAPTIPLPRFRELTEALVESGADIHEINTVRKRLSRVKGGGLADAAAPATVLALLVSDVIGDDPGVIASGPFERDEPTAEAARAVLERYDVPVDETVREALDAGEPRDEGDGEAEATVHTHLLVRTRTAVDAAADLAFESGYDPLVLSSSMRGEAREIALAHVAVAEEVGDAGDPVAPPAAVLSGGEVTVTVTGDGEGGPNLELALAAAIDLPAGVTLATVDTDGADGGTDVAGAVVDDRTVTDADEARDALAANDALPYLAARDALLEVESTTNVNDLRIVLVE